MQDATIAEIERWLRACAREAELKSAEDAAASSTDAAATDPEQQQDRPYWPYLDSEDFWRE